MRLMNNTVELGGGYRATWEIAEEGPIYAEFKVHRHGKLTFRAMELGGAPPETFAGCL